MKPEEVPDDLVDLSVAAWHESGRYLITPIVRVILSAFLTRAEGGDVSRELSEFPAPRPYITEATEAVGAFLQQQDIPEPVRSIVWRAFAASDEVYEAEIERLRTELAQAIAARETALSGQQQAEAAAGRVRQAIEAELADIVQSIEYGKQPFIQGANIAARSMCNGFLAALEGREQR